MSDNVLSIDKVGVRRRYRPLLEGMDDNVVAFEDGTHIREVRHSLTNIVILREHLDENGLPHRDGDKAARFLYNGLTGELCQIQYWKHGKLHREGCKPAIISLDYDYEKYYLNGLPCEPYGPPTRESVQPRKIPVDCYSGEAVI